MTKTEKAALQESVVQVGAALIINFPLQTFLLWLFIERWALGQVHFLISLTTTFIFTVVALIRTYMIRMEIEKRRRHGLWRKVRNSGGR